MGDTNDPIADLLTRLRNATRARKCFCDIGHSRIKEAIVKILKDTGFIAHYLIKEENRKGTIRIFLKYTDKRESVLQGLKRISSPSRRRYVSSDRIPHAYGDMAHPILSTPQGVMTGKDARAKNVGGEVLCLVW